LRFAARARASGTGSAHFFSTMRHDDEDDPKKPRPVQVPKKGTNAVEASEGVPWLLRKDGDRDHHRHVV
jgi:hypothetical protein